LYAKEHANVCNNNHTSDANNVTNHSGWFLQIANSLLQLRLPLPLVPQEVAVGPSLDMFGIYGPLFLQRAIFGMNNCLRCVNVIFWHRVSVITVGLMSLLFVSMVWRVLLHPESPYRDMYVWPVQVYDVMMWL
jgi:hypothetical protein